jgi:hypothetical protein
VRAFIKKPLVFAALLCALVIQAQMASRMHKARA